MKQPDCCSSVSPSQLLSFTSEGLEGHLGFGEVLVPVVLHVQVDLTASRPLPQLQGDLPAGGINLSMPVYTSTFKHYHVSLWTCDEHI